MVECFSLEGNEIIQYHNRLWFQVYGYRKIDWDGIIDEYDVDVLFVRFNNWCQMILLIGLKVQLQGSFVLLKCDTSKTN